MEEKDKLCCLSLDEIEVTAAVEYDPSCKRILVDTTLPGSTGRANHGLVFMLGGKEKSECRKALQSLVLASKMLKFLSTGICERWKQVVAYHLTGRSIDGSELYRVVVDIIKQASAIGFKVVAVTSDIGPSNRAMWRKAGIESKRDSLVSCIGNPHLTTNDKVHFLADVKKPAIWMAQPQDCCTFSTHSYCKQSAKP